MSIKNDNAKVKDAVRGFIEGLTRIKPITKDRTQITEVLKFDLIEKINEDDYEKLIQIYLKEFDELKMSLSNQ